jgi:hypothetical protein
MKSNHGADASFLLAVCATPATSRAAEKGDKNAVRADRGADVNAPQAGGTTALSWAVYRSDLEIADLLIRAGANVNAANREATRWPWVGSAAR